MDLRTGIFNNPYLVESKKKSKIPNEILRTSPVRSSNRYKLKEIYEDWLGEKEFKILRRKKNDFIFGATPNFSILTSPNGDIVL